MYLRGRPGKDEYFVVFDRITSTKAEYAKHFMLHVPDEPTVSGTATDLVANHVISYSGDKLISSWLSRPDDFGKDTPVLSTGRSRMFMRTVLPDKAIITKRGGDGYRNWGHPLEPTAQYDHTGPGRDEAPLCDWRLEVAAPASEQTYFLHVFQVSDDTVTAMEPVTVISQAPLVRIEIGSGQQVWKVAFATHGELSGEITAPGATTGERLPATAETAPQYQAWQEAIGADGVAPRTSKKNTVEPATKPALVRMVPTESAAKAWDSALYARITTLCGENHGPSFQMSAIHDTVRIESADGAGNLQLRSNGSTLAWKWQKLDNADRLKICLVIQRAMNAEDAALTAFHLLCEGRSTEADELLRNVPADQAAALRAGFSTPADAQKP